MRAERVRTFMGGVFVVFSLQPMELIHAGENYIGAAHAQLRELGGIQGNTSASHSAPPGDETTAIDLPEVTIESDSPASEPSLEQRARKFRETLRRPPDSAVSERELGDGVVELTTRFGRLCARSLPLKSQYGPGTDTTLFVPCTHF